MRFRQSKAMATTVTVDPRVHQKRHQHYGGASAVEEIKGVIRVSREGQVERGCVVPTVAAGPTAHDAVIDSKTGVWARVYAPAAASSKPPPPVVVYFHGGGFCVGSAAWKCYDDFLSSLSQACLVVSVSYRLAPENRLPAAYDDGCAALDWLRRRNLAASGVFLAGDSAGANIAYHVAARYTGGVRIRGLLLVQPFFGGEARTPSERGSSPQPPGSALTVPAADAYWRMALPPGAGRDHPWCNPLVGASVKVAAARIPERVMVCVSEMDVLRDRNVEFAGALAGAGKRVETRVYRGVGHAFQILHNSHFAKARTQEMLSHIKNFIAQ